MKTDIPLPRLLAGTGYAERRIRPEKVSMNLSITPLSYATMELPTGESLPERGYVELFNCMGSAGIFRVRSPQDAYGEDITTAELEHAIVEVGDYIVRTKYDEMMAAGAAMQAIFSHYRGSLWQLGSVAAMGSGQIAVQQDHTRVLEAMLALLDQTPSCMLAFDFSTTPWTVSVVSRGTTVTAEGRLSRNVNSARVIYDDTELCTRAYYELPDTEDAKPGNFPAFNVNKNNSSGSYVTNANKLYYLPNGHVKGTTWEDTDKTLKDDAPTTSWAYMDADTQAIYGIVEREVRTGSNYTLAEIQRVVTDYLRKHKKPRASVDISAAEFSTITGEPLDSFEIGKLFRLALPDYNNLTVEDNITALIWSDVYDDPYNIAVNLAEEEDTAITFLHDLDAKGGGGGGGGGAKKEEEVWKEYRTHFEQTDYYFDMYAQRVSRAEEVLQQAGLYIDSNGVLIYAEDDENSLAGKLKVQADKISLIVEDTEDGAKINPAAIVLAINDAISQIKISADAIDIDGVISQLTTKTINAIAVETAFFRFGNQSVSWRTTTVVTAVTKPSLGRTGSVTVDGKTGTLVTSWSDGSVTTDDIHYLGRASV